MAPPLAYRRRPLTREPSAVDRRRAEQIAAAQLRAKHRAEYEKYVADALADIEAVGDRWFR